MPSHPYKRVKVICLLILITLVLVACAPAQAPSPMETASKSPTNTPVAAATPTAVVIEVTSTSVTPPVSSGPFKLFTYIDEVLAGSVSTLLAAEDGSLWLVSSQDVVKISGDEPVVFLEDYKGQLAGVDAAGRVWVVSEDTAQISTWDGQLWSAYAEADGWVPLAGNYGSVSGGQSDLQDRLWFATTQDVRVFDGEKWAITTRNIMGMAPPVYEDLMQTFNIKTLKNGEVWVGECDWGGPGPFGGGGVRWLAGGEWQGSTSPAASGCVNALVEDALGRVWVGVDSSLWRYDPANGDWVVFPSPETPIAEMRFGFLDSLAVDPANEAWAELVLCGGASCYGSSALYHLRDEEWIQVGTVGEYDSGYWGPVFDANGTPWVYWEGGIYRINEDVPELVSPLAGQVSARGSDGRVWFVAPHEKRDALWVLDEKALE